MGWDPAHLELKNATGYPASKSKRKAIVEKSIGYPEGFIDKLIAPYAKYGTGKSGKAARKAASKSGEISAAILNEAFKKNGVDLAKLGSSKVDQFNQGDF